MQDVVPEPSRYLGGFSRLCSDSGIRWNGFRPQGNRKRRDDCSSAQFTFFPFQMLSGILEAMPTEYPLGTIRLARPSPTPTAKERIRPLTSVGGNDRHQVRSLQQELFGERNGGLLVRYYKITRVAFTKL